jgi:transposase
MMPKSHRQCPPGSRRQMIELVRRGRTQDELARDFEPEGQAIPDRVKETALDAGQGADALTMEERDEVGRRRARGLAAPRRAGDAHKKCGLVSAEDHLDPVEGSEFVTAHPAVHRLTTMWRAVGFSRSGYRGSWRRLTAHTPRARMRRATRLRPTRIRWAARSALGWFIERPAVA